MIYINFLSGWCWAGIGLGRQTVLGLKELRGRNKIMLLRSVSLMDS